MKRLAACFDTPDALLQGAKKVKAEGFSAVDTITPFHLPEAVTALDIKKPAIRPTMAAAGFAMAAVAYGLEWFSSAIAYPINSGGRPLNSWPVFLLVPFEVGVLSAGIAGFITFLIHCRMPSLHHPIFAVDGIARASSDRFFLIVEDAADETAKTRLRELLRSEGARSVEEMTG